nr:MAG TPA: hypothetical protein [Caudoviricetes sp.]
MLRTICLLSTNHGPKPNACVTRQHGYCRSGNPRAPLPGRHRCPAALR